MKAIFSAAVLAGFTFFGANSATAQAPQAAGQDTKPADARAAEFIVKPELAREQLTELANARRQRARAPCTPTTKIAVSVHGEWHGTAGADVLIPYPNITTNISNVSSVWFGQSFFVAPCGGLYFFTVSFVKDTYYNTCGGNVGTTDDVMVYLTKYVGSTPTIIHSTGAWSGEGAGRRGTGVYSVALQLNQSDIITSWVHSDGGRHRCLASYHFTGFRIAP
jgi:hypothetical protein